MTPRRQRLAYWRDRRKASAATAHYYVPEFLADVVPLEPGGKATPELELAAAVLNEVLIDLHRGPLRKWRQAYRSAREWVESELCHAWPFSFTSLCSLLGLDEDATRARLLAIKPDGRGKSGSRALRGENRRKGTMSAEMRTRSYERWARRA